MPTEKPEGINVGELLTERSKAGVGDSTISDFKAADKLDDDTVKADHAKATDDEPHADVIDSEDYSDDDDQKENEISVKDESQNQKPLYGAEIEAIPLESPEDLKLAMEAKEGQNLPSAIKQAPQLNIEESHPSEIEEDYEF